MTGVLVEVGRGNLSSEDVASFFKGKTDIPTKLTAPPSGLFLEKVWYNRDEIDFTINPLIRI
jgi:tRNA pseudouridine38-40 synthase